MDPNRVGLLLKSNTYFRAGTFPVPERKRVLKRRVRTDALQGTETTTYKKCVHLKAGLAF